MEAPAVLSNPDYSAEKSFITQSDRRQIMPKPGYHQTPEHRQAISQTVKRQEEVSPTSCQTQRISQQNMGSQAVARFSTAVGLLHQPVSGYSDSLCNTRSSHNAVGPRRPVEICNPDAASQAKSRGSAVVQKSSGQITPRCIQPRHQEAFSREAKELTPQAKKELNP